MMPELSQQQTAKLVLLGEMGSGKSSLVLRYVKGQFFDYQVRVRCGGSPPRARGRGGRGSAPAGCREIFAPARPGAPARYEVGRRRAALAGLHRGRRLPHKDQPGAERQV
jgi:GTPase SAR1 family protein